MSKTKIEWAETVWNPVVGCSKVSQGCKNCYAEVMAKRLKAMGRPEYQDVIGDNGRWTGKVTLIHKRLTAPYTWSKPQLVFVNSMSDLFHDSVPDEYIYAVLNVARNLPQHTFMILTKRPKRMAKFVNSYGPYDLVTLAGAKNIWLGVCVEDQDTADQRIPLLLQTPASVRFVSYEPAIGPVDFQGWDGKYQRNYLDPGFSGDRSKRGPLDWIIMGGESGPGARPMHPDWARSVRDQCQKAGVKLFFKQWGEWLPVCPQYPEGAEDPNLDDLDLFAYQICFGNKGTVYSESRGLKEDYWCGYQPDPWQNPWFFERVGKKAAGRMLDGREWNEFPGDDDHA